jgi:AraC-like DNA-binding protein
MQRPETIRSRRALFEDAARVIQSDYASDLQLEEVGRQVAASRRQLQRVFLEVGGTTFREYVTQVRMARAADLLAQDMTVREVALRVGYRQPAQFAKAFRRHHGVSPSEYRAHPRQPDQLDGDGRSDGHRSLDGHAAAAA